MPHIKVLISDSSPRAPKNSSKLQIDGDWGCHVSVLAGRAVAYGCCDNSHLTVRATLAGCTTPPPRSMSSSASKEVLVLASHGVGGDGRRIWCSWVLVCRPLRPWTCNSGVGDGEVGEPNLTDEALGSAPYLISTFFSTLTLSTVAAPILVPVPFVRLDGSESPRLMSCAVPRPNLCLQLPGTIFLVVQKSTVLKKPCSMNTAAVQIVTGKGTVLPEKVENREAAIGRTITV